MAGNDKLCATLINNLGSALVKQGKIGEALSVRSIYPDLILVVI